jgi:ComF family protein
VVYEPLLRALFPERCPGCRESTDEGFCSHCVADFRHLLHPCVRCGLPLPVAACPRRLNGWHVGAVTAPFVYAAPLDHYMRELKYRGARNLGRALGLLLAAAVAGEAADVDAVLPMPLHAQRLRERGYNQATEIARAVARSSRLPLLHGARRLRASPTQTSLDARARYANSLGAFAVPSPLAGRRIAIVDDVITTGATINALAEAALAAGASRVDAWAVARTLP